jgi:hypothetical protein
MDVFIQESQSIIRQIFMEAKTEGFSLLGCVSTGVWLPTFFKGASVNHPEGQRR